MSLAVPPPLPIMKPGAEPAWRTYLGAGAFLVPALLVWVFANLVMLPRVEKIWEMAGLSDSRAQWLIDLSRGLSNNLNFVAMGVGAVFVFLELRWSRWPRYRSGTIWTATFLINSAVLIGMVMICICATLAVPHLLKVAK